MQLEDLYYNGGILIRLGKQRAPRRRYSSSILRFIRNGKSCGRFHLQGQNAFLRNAKAQTLIEPARAILRPHCQRQLRARRFASLLTEPKRPAPQTSTAMRGQYSNINDPP